MKFHQIGILVGLMLCTTSLQASEYRSEVWCADCGDGSYRNPILHADYSDPDVVRVGEEYWMTASSFNCIPGLPILHSKDLVNWQFAGYALRHLPPSDFFAVPQHGRGVWAPCIKHHDGWFYIYWGDPDFGIYMVKSRDPRGTWSEPVLVKAGKGLIDPSPLWDDDGRLYLAHAWAGSRSGLNSIITLVELNSEGTKVISDEVMIF
ncbi:MAG: family 43 glycosylhydrolase, partial [Alistipes sp.]|nr:family 43 glycosylhydrolase [Alistipes sp.]